MIRARFFIKFKDCGNDYRPIKWPIKYPYWCTGESTDCFIIVAYADNVEQIMELWPEACFIEPKEVDKIEFTDRFPKPKWYNGKCDEQRFEYEQWLGREHPAGIKFIFKDEILEEKL